MVGDLGVRFLEDRNRAGFGIEDNASFIRPSGRQQRLLNVCLVDHRSGWSRNPCVLGGGTEGFEPSDMAADVELCLQDMLLDDDEDHHDSHDCDIHHVSDLSVDDISTSGTFPCGGEDTKTGVADIRDALSCFHPVVHFAFCNVFFEHIPKILPHKVGIDYILCLRCDCVLGFLWRVSVCPFCEEVPADVNAGADESNDDILLNLMCNGSVPVRLIPCNPLCLH